MDGPTKLPRGGVQRPLEGGGGAGGGVGGSSLWHGQSGWKKSLTGDGARRRGWRGGWGSESMTRAVWVGEVFDRRGDSDEGEEQEREEGGENEDEKDQSLREAVH